MYSILDIVCCAPLQSFVRRVLSMMHIECTGWDGLVCVSSTTCICWMDLQFRPRSGGMSTFVAWLQLASY